MKKTAIIKSTLNKMGIQNKKVLNNVLSFYQEEDNDIFITKIEKIPSYDNDLQLAFAYATNNCQIVCDFLQIAGELVTLSRRSMKRETDNKFYYRDFKIEKINDFVILSKDYYEVLTLFKGKYPEDDYAIQELKTIINSRSTKYLRVKRPLNSNDRAHLEDKSKLEMIDVIKEHAMYKPFNDNNVEKGIAIILDNLYSIIKSSIGNNTYHYLIKEGIQSYQISKEIFDCLKDDYHYELVEELLNPQFEKCKKEL